MTAPTNPAPPAEKLVSRVMRFQEGWRWEGIPVRDYKQKAEHHCGVVRTTLVGANGERAAFQVRYFEIAPGGYSSFEQHAHEHAVIVLRGQGQVQLGETVHEIGHGDAVYVAPHESHQFRNPSATEPFGFLCIVDAERDRPLPLKTSNHRATETQRSKKTGSESENDHESPE